MAADEKIMNQGDKITNKITIKDKYTIGELIGIMSFLRSEQGCPWDREQDHISLRENMLEEAYEAIDAIDSGSADRICDELGDVLMQVVFHAQIASEKGDFTFDDVISGICRKLISRHTHIFAGDEAATVAEVIETWEKNKRREKGHSSRGEVLLDVPRSLPALLRSYKVQKKAAGSGFDWPDAAGPREKVFEEMAEIENCLAETESNTGTGIDEQPGQEQKREELEREVGDLLFSAVNYARHLDVQPELALNNSADRFIRRFVEVEKLAEARGLVLEAMSLAEMDQLWDQVKELEKKT